MQKILGHLKGLAAALWPLYEVFRAATSDGAITNDEYGAIGKAFVFFVTVWLVPNIGYVRTLRGKVFVGQDKLQDKIDDHADVLGKHEDRDGDGVPDVIELAQNDPSPRQRLYDRTAKEHTDEWPKSPQEPRS